MYTPYFTATNASSTPTGTMGVISTSSNMYVAILKSSIANITQRIDLSSIQFMPPRYLFGWNLR